MAVQQSDPLLGIEEAAEYVGRNLRFMRQMVAERKIEHLKVGGLLRFRQSALDAFLADATRRQVGVVCQRAEKARRTTKASA